MAAVTERALLFDDGLARGAACVADAAADGAGWVALRVADDVRGLGAIASAAAARRMGVIVFLDSTAALHELGGALAALGPQEPAKLRDRLLVVVPGERIGRRVRGDARWAPSALDLGAALAGGMFARFVASRFPNHARAKADADDLVVPAGRFDAASAAALAAMLRRRGARLWVLGESAGAGADCAHGVILRAR